jgi:hypothetical protein
MLSWRLRAFAVRFDARTGPAVFVAFVFFVFEPDSEARGAYGRFRWRAMRTRLPRTVTIEPSISAGG